MRRIIAVIIVITILFTSLPVYALEMSDLVNAQDEVALREAIRGDALWENSFPNGLFNFIGTQHVVNESNNFLEIAIARQGGTVGDVSVDFKAIDISAEYGVDYVIRVYENSAKLEIKKNENAVPFIETLQNNPEINISETDDSTDEEITEQTPETGIVEPESDTVESEPNIVEPESDTVETEPNTVEPELNIAELEPDIVEPESDALEPEQQMSESAEDMVELKNDPATESNEQEYIDLEPKTIEIGGNNSSNSSKTRSLRALRESALKEKSDRPDWKTIDRDTIEQLKSEYDEFFYNVPGTETTIEFKDGEYIKYLYIVPLKDNISESEEQILFALTNPTGGTVRGEFYMAYVNIRDDEALEASSFELISNSVIAKDGKTSVVVKRTGGIDQYASIYIGTEEGTAISGVDYVPGLQELFFTPGMTEQTVSVNLLDNPERVSTREFKIALDRENENVNLEKAVTIVVISVIEAAEPNPTETETIEPDSQSIQTGEADSLALSLPQAEPKANLVENTKLLSMATELSAGVLAKSETLNETGAQSAAELKSGLGTLAADGALTESDASAATETLGILAGPGAAIEGVEKISPYGSSNAKGKWTLSLDDFLNVPFYGAYYASKDMGKLLLAADKSPRKESFASTEEVKLFGVESADISYMIKGTDNSHRFTFEALSPDSPGNSPYMEILNVTGNLKTSVNAPISENMWDSHALSLRISSNSEEYSRVWIDPINLNLKKYNLVILNDVANVPEFQVNKYKIENGELKATDIILKAQPGRMTVKSVYSTVNNNQTPAPGAANISELYRSDFIEFNVEYFDNIAGRIAKYDGFEIFVGDGKWEKLKGKTLSLDKDFYAQENLRKAISGGTILVRPIFKRKSEGRSKVQIVVDKNNGYIRQLGENVGKIEFPVKKAISREIAIELIGGRIVIIPPKYEYSSFIDIGDVISLSAKNYNPSITPSWSANNNSAIMLKDTDGSNINVDFQLTDWENYLKVDFVKPTIIVKANPNVYLHNVSKPTYKIDDVTYTDMTKFRDEMEKIFDINSDVDENGDLITSNDVNPEITLTFNYTFNEEYPDPNNEKKDAFGTPQKAILTVYKSDATKRAEYPSIKDQSSPAGYTVTANNGTYTYSGKLNDLGWEEGDYATVIIYGSSRNSGVLASTRETVIDFLANSGNSIIVEGPDKDILGGGDIYNPLTINNADPIRSYSLTSFVAPGFVTKWGDYSGDINGDGEVSVDEYMKLESRMKALGSNLDDIYKNKLYTELFWGNFYNYVPRFNPSKVLYNFEKAPTGNTSWKAGVIIQEVYRTVLNPQEVSDNIPLKDTDIIIGEDSYKTDKYGSATIINPMFEEGKYYLVRVIHKGYEFFTYVKPGGTVKHVFDTTDIMRPFDFTATYKEKDTSAPETINLKERLVPVRSGITEFKFRINQGGEGVAANDAIIRVYSTTKEGFRDEVKYEKMTGAPSYSVFTHSLDLISEHIEPGYRMTISPLYLEGGKILKEYPEVDVGFAFSLDLDLITTLGSFKTHTSPVVEFLGKVTNSFDLSMDVELDDFTTEGTRKDEDGVIHNTKIITFGYNKDFEKVYGKEKDDKKDEKIVITLEDMANNGGSGDKNKNTQDAVKKNTSGSGDKKKTSSSGTLNYGFEVSLALTIEQGGNYVNGQYFPDGFHYFDSMVLMVSGKANYVKKYTYITPIGIPVYASINIHGTASLLLGAEANRSKRYINEYRFQQDGEIPFDYEYYSLYTKFFLTPGITLEAGAGDDDIKVFLEGNATVDMNFTAPITEGNEKSSGNGGLVISAKVGVKILFIQKKWTIYKSKRFELFSYGKAQQTVIDALSDPYTNYLYQRVEAPEEDDIIPRDYLLNTSGWLGNEELLGEVNSTEKELLQGAYPYPQTKIITFNNKLLVLFIGDPGESIDENGNIIRDKFNRAQLFYTIYDGNTWTEPAAVDADITWDEAPDAFMVDDKILVTWADAGRIFDGTDTAATTLSAMDISGRWFDVATSAFEGPEFPITQYTEIFDDEIGDIVPFDNFADINPMIAYDPGTERLMVYYTKIDYNLSNDPDGSQPREYDNTPIHDETADKDYTDDGENSTVYGDIVNGYNVIAFRYAQKQPDGSFLWNTTYEESEGLNPKDFTPEGFYGQRFLDLAVLADITETEKEILPDSDTYTIGTEQVVTAVAVPNKDPLVTDSALIEYNGLAIYSYVLDRDSSKTSTDDQELYMQIYNFDTNEFHHPIRLTNNTVQDTKPQFMRKNGITYLYWLSGGDIVYMDITNIIREDLLKKVDITVSADKTKSIYILDKSNSTISGFIKMAVDSRDDYPIEDYQIKSNGENEYLLWTDYVISYKNGLKPGDPGSEKPENINKEKQIFAAYHDSQSGWSKSVQLTQEAGANYSDISFEVNDNDDIKAVYIKYGQKLEEETKTFTKDTANCTFAAAVFDIESTLEAGKIETSDELPQRGKALDFSVEINNTGVKPLKDLKYVTYMKQNGEESIVKDSYDILSADRRKLILGGDNVKLQGTFDMPEDIENVAVGFRILDGANNLLLETEKDIRAEAILNIAVMNGVLKDENTANLSLRISNDGNVGYDGLIGIFHESNNVSLKGIDVILGVGESELLNIDLPIDPSMFTAVETAEDGSVFDKLELNITDGVYSLDTDIKRVAEKSVVDSVNNVKSFSVNKSYLSINEGSAYKLKANTVLNTPIPECTADPMQVKWRTSNADVASVLPDGTVLGLSNGSAKITATLLPSDDTTTELEDGTIGFVDNSFKLPANMIQERSVTVVVGDNEPDDDKNNNNIIIGNEETEQPGENEQTEEIKQSDDEVIIELEPKTEGNTSTIIPGESTIFDALKRLKDENKSTLTFISSDRDDNANDNTSDNTSDNTEVSKLVITGDVLNAIAGSEASRVVFGTPFGKMAIEKETIDALQQIASETGEKQDITIQISKVDIENYPDDLKKLIGDRPVYDFSIMVGDKNLSKILDEPVELTLELDNMPQTDPSINEDQIVGAYIAEGGVYKLIPLSALVDGKLIIKTTHNSVYGGLYNNVKFKDVSGWSEDYIAFLSARGVINGKGSNNFAPKDNITRSEFVKIMAMIADVDTSKFTGSSFKDVDINKWYAPYIEWAYSSGLVNGVGGGMFAPDKDITREDMAVLISRFADILDFSLPELSEEKAFKDDREIAKYAREAVKSIQRAGIINGKPNSTFAPKDNASREEAAKVFTVLIKIGVDKSSQVQ